MRFALALLMVSFIVSCSTFQEENKTHELLEWVFLPEIPEELTRISSSVIIDQSTAYLLPGKGNGRFSSVPEIVELSNDCQWELLGSYQGVAKAGRSAYFKNNDDIIVVGGVNFANAPFDEIAKTSLDGGDYTRLNSNFPKGTLSTKCFAQLNDIGYVGYSNEETIQTPAQNGITSYNIQSGEWTDICIPNTLSSPVSNTLMTSSENAIFLYDQNHADNNFFMYEADENNWKSLDNFPGKPRFNALIIGTSEEIYVGFGNDDSQVFNDLWKYNILENEWAKFQDYPGKAFHSGIGFFLDNQLFFGAGSSTIIIGENDTPLNTEMYSIRIR